MCLNSGVVCQLMFTLLYAQVFKMSEIFCLPPAQKIGSTYSEFNFCRLNAIFFSICSYLLKSTKSKYLYILQEDSFDTLLDLNKHDNRFLDFFRDSLEVNTALSKLISMRIFCKKMRRNRLLKLPTFSCCFSTSA